MDGGSTEDAGGGSFASLGGLERWRAYSRVAAWCLVLCVSVLLNSTLLVAFVRRPGLRTISNRFVMNLIASNLLAAFVLTGLLIADSCGDASASLGTYSTTPSFCALAEGATALVTTSSILSVLLIGIDQYLAVVDPLRYRTRIDKLKCGLLILAVWLIALAFGALASLNPQPRSLCWLQSGLDDDVRTLVPEIDASAVTVADHDTELRFQASLVLDGNATESADLEIEGEISFRHNDDVDENDGIDDEDDSDYDGSYNITETLLSRDNLTVGARYISARTGRATYGLVYALVYAFLGYLVPFLAIFWIYVKIYTAARSNSERTRRNGSRPILSSGSFSEDAGSQANGYLPGHRTDSSLDDFRRIPKISSLSSIDENSEASPSQIISSSPRATNEHPLLDGGRRLSNEAVVFTVGSTAVERHIELPGINGVNEEDEENSELEVDADDDNAKDSTKSKVPIAALKAKFLMGSSGKRVGSPTAAAAVKSSTGEDEKLVRSKFPEVTEQRRKSSHDLMYEEMMLGGCGKHPYEYDDDDDDEDDVLDNSSDDDDDDDVAGEEGHDYEEALPLSSSAAAAAEAGHGDHVIHNSHSSARSISVNFDLGEPEQPSHTDVTRNQSNLSSGSVNSNNPGTPSHPPPIVTITPAPGQQKTSGPHPVPLHRVPSVKSTQGYINNLKYRISNGSLFKYREETRAARISALVIVMGFICWTPYVYVLLLRNRNPSEITTTSGVGDEVRLEPEPHPSLDATALGFLVLATYVSPLLFGYRSRRVKRELRKFFCFKRELSYKNNRSLMAKKVLRRRHSGATILGQFVGESNNVDNSRYNIFNCVYGRNRWPKEKVQFVQVPETALAVETCRSSFSSGASTQISSTSTDEC